MGFLFGRKGSNETDGRRGDVAKKSASLLAAVAVAGGSAVVGLPQAEAGQSPEPYYFEKIDPDGNPLGGSEWEIRPEDSESMRIIDSQWGESSVLGNYKIVDNYVPKERDERDEDGFILVEDLDPRPGHFAFRDIDLNLPHLPFRATALSIREVKRPDGYDSCGADRPVVSVERPRSVTEKGSLRVTSGNAEVRVPTDKRIQPGAFSPSSSTGYSGHIDWAGTNESAEPIVYLPEQFDHNVTPAVVKDANGNSYEYERWAFQPIHVIGAIVNCPVPTTTVETTAPVTTVTTTNPASTVTPPPATATVPGGTVTKPGTTNTTVVAAPPVTVTPAPTTKTGPVEIVTLPGTTVSLPDVTSTRPNLTVTKSPSAVTTTVSEPAVTAVVTSTITEPTPVPTVVETSNTTTTNEVTTTQAATGAMSENRRQPTVEDTPRNDDEKPLEPAIESSTTVTVDGDTATPTATVENGSRSVLATTGANGLAIGTLALIFTAVLGCAVTVRRKVDQQ